MMKSIFYIAVIAVILSSCVSTRGVYSSMEDDIYYVPGAKPLVVKEVEEITGQHVQMQPQTRNHTYPEDNYTSSTLNQSAITNRGIEKTFSTSELMDRAQERLNSAEQVNEVLYENPGYWIGGFKGNSSDMQEAFRIMAQYPEGFGFVGNGTDIAFNLSVSPDWNVYTNNGRYWWFPSSTNIQLYNTLLFGTYPKYIWTVAWNDPWYDSWTFNNQFNIHFGWGRPGWSLGFGWNSGYYRPWWGGWYGPGWGGWYDPWWGNSWYPGWYPGWGYPHWHYPHWGGHYPNWGPPAVNRPGNPRPNFGSGSIGTRPGNVRPGNNSRPNYNTGRPNSRPGINTTRPGNMTRPGTITRPNYNTGRPAGNITPTTRPNYNTTNPNTTRPTNNNSRPATTRPNTTSPNRYTRPATRPNVNSGSTRSYNRQQNTSRPSYNNNRINSPSYRPATPSRNYNYSPARTTSPSRSGGTTRSTGRNGGGRR